MRFLADENFPGNAVKGLRAEGRDVWWVRTEAPGLTDTDVFQRALAEQRVVLTFDKDFGELAWRFRHPAYCGIVLFRLPMPPPKEAGTIFARILGTRSDWVGHFSVVEPGRVRMRPLPRDA